MMRTYKLNYTYTIPTLQKGLFENTITIKAKSNGLARRIFMHRIRKNPSVDMCTIVSCKLLRR